MILRPESDAELLALIAEVTNNPALQLDTAAMLAALLARKDLDLCPFKLDIAAALGRDDGKIIGAVRAARMYREAERAGYMARATWYVPRVGRRPLYSFIVGSKAAVSEAQLKAGARG